MYRQNCLLSFAFDGNESCLWLLSSDADCPCVRCIRFVPQYKGPYRASRYEPRFMPKGLQSSRPVVGASAGFHHDNRGGTFRKEFEHLRALEFESFNLAALRIERVKLKYLLGDVHPDDREFHFGFPLKNG